MKIGIAGSGGIVKECLKALREVDDVQCTAICGRKKSMDKLTALAEEFAIANVYTDYETMLADASLDFIYVGIVNSMHNEYAEKALLAGKHVICEKPLTSTAAETRALIALAKSKRLFFFEAITLLYSPNYLFIKDNVDKIGQIRIVQANYFQYSSRYDRYLKQEVLPAFDPALSGGALYDINIYNLHVVIGLFGEPLAVSYAANTGFNGIDTSGIATLQYDGFIASCGGAKDSESQSGIIIQGEKGFIRLNGAPNVCATVDVKIDRKMSHYNGETHEHRMVDEFAAFSKMYKEKDLARCYAYLEHSAAVMNTADKARRSAGIVFAADEKQK